MGRIMALDVGGVRIGIATTDILHMIASPLETYKSVNTEKDVEYIANLALKMDVELIIVGLPLKMDGTDSEQTIKTRAFGDKLAEAVAIPIKYQDERLTSVSAESILIEADVRREKRKDYIDKIAAAIILQNYLDYKS